MQIGEQGVLKLGELLGDLRLAAEHGLAKLENRLPQGAVDGQGSVRAVAPRPRPGQESPSDTTERGIQFMDINGSLVQRGELDVCTSLLMARTNSSFLAWSSVKKSATDWTLATAGNCLESSLHIPAPGAHRRPHRPKHADCEADSINLRS